MESARCVPDPLADAHALIDAGQPRQAAELLRPMVASGRGGALARLVLARALCAAGEAGEALAVAREAALLFPGLSDAAVVLGECLAKADLLPTAIAEFQRALRLDPEQAEARQRLGEAWLAAGEAERALDAFAGLPPDTAGLQADIVVAQMMLARPRSDPGYVRHLFDQFSADYDARMQEHLLYRAPQILRELADLVLPGRDDLAILDLGCGTGLSGEAFHDRARRLDGIDLSPAMVAKARARGIYDHLAVADIESWSGVADYDVVLAADTVVYLGDLAPVLEVVGRALLPEGYILFTAEAAEGEGFELGPKRRWRHSEVYLRRAARQSGFAIGGLVSCTPRREAHVPVEGFAVALRKAAQRPVTAGGNT
ncbi:MAG: methyltransferase domain-containing protein [Alphaproteobacteria bacterium]|nr:methyltransferase domain-containing protein [Alphaproteobacteria bacterium]